MQNLLKIGIFTRGTSVNLPQESDYTTPGKMFEIWLFRSAKISSALNIVDTQPDRIVDR